MARKPADQSVSREDILEAAADVLRRNGYESTTMKDIAAEVNLTAASLYHHFRNKDSLLLAVLEIGLEQIISQIEPLIQQDMPLDCKLRQMIHAHIVGLTSHTAVAAAMVFEIRSLLNMKSPSAGASTADREAYTATIRRRDAFFARRDRFEELFRSVVQEGIQAGAFYPVDVGIFTKALLGAHNWVGVWYREGGRLNGSEIADLMADTFLRSLQK
ncbi:MAG: TetR/AcrR family transcriptional regulator [Anaerolineaceae bacterium]|nr:TetR/AcrR family transcriptional regulator [Anaerolineaceae bacterium]